MLRTNTTKHSKLKFAALLLAVIITAFSPFVVSLSANAAERSSDIGYNAGKSH